MKKQTDLTKFQKELCERVANNPDLLKEVLRLVRLSSKPEHRFDLNLAEGMVSERLLQKILTGEETVEVKRDFKVSATGNIVIEHGHNHGKKKSGITTSEADWYALILDGEEFEGEVVVFIKTERLRQITELYGTENRLSGTRGYSNFKLLRVENLFTPNEEL